MGVIRHGKQRGVCHGSSDPLRSDFDAATLRQLARRSSDPGQARRLVALAAIYEGAPRGRAAEIAGVTPQIARDWVVRFNEEGPDGLVNRKAPGPEPRLTDGQRRALAERVEAGPDPAVDGVVRWRLVDLAHWAWQAFRISISVQTLSRELRAMGFAKLSARPRHHAQEPDAIETFKKTSAAP